MQSNYSVFKSAAGEKIVMEDYARNLEQWPLPYETFSVATRYADTHVITWGKPGAPPLVILHGGGGNGSRLWEYAGELGRHYRIYAPDLPGDFGKSIQHLPMHTNHAYLAWLGGLLANLKLDRVYILGFSAGGFLAMHAALSLPNRILKAAVYAPAGAVCALSLKYVYTLLTCWIGPNVRQKIEKLISYSSAGVFPPDPRLVEQIYHTALYCKNRGFLQLRKFTDKELAAIKVPVLVLAGDKEVIYKAEKVGKRLDGLTGRTCLQFRLLPGAGHFPPGAGSFTPHVLEFFGV